MTEEKTQKNKQSSKEQGNVARKLKTTNIPVIWQCSFEPDPSDPSKFTDIVATCGGTSVCFISVKTGEVILKYNRNMKGAATENLYALAWTSLPLDDVGLKRMNILATAGGKSTVIIIHPEANCCYQMFRTVPNKANAVVCSLLFHPKKASWLFCGHDDGHIQLWDIGIPSLPKYDSTPVFIFRMQAVGADAYNLAFSQTNDILIAGCDKGLFAWNIDVEKIKNNEKLNYFEFKIDLPIVKEAGNVVDSICLIRDNILAFKCALHGSIYICNLSQCIKTVKNDQLLERNLIELNKESLLTLKWSDTDNYYMNMGADSKSCTLVCGDDKGTLWIYDLANYVNGQIKSPLFDNISIDQIDPHLKLDWPELDDAEVEKARKLRIDTYDIVVDKCTVSDGGQHIVAVTSNNMVCIWKRGEE
ncbi:Leucine-rich repeat and WD repeat-containing protein 1 [Armadillidium vulgare]|nr:Leucine-rich repeat and WD repeat-containing protein 1 [Armadillidium vulgare]